MNDFWFYLEENKEVGYVNSFFHSLAFVSGLPNLELEEVVITEDGKIGIVQGLKRDFAEILMFEHHGLKIGERVARTNKKFSISISEEILGRIVNPLLKPLDGLGPIGGERKERFVYQTAPTIFERKKIEEPFETGVMLVDLLIPLGCGQRELIIGDPKTGKTTFALQAMVTQAKKGVIPIYVGIAKKDTAVKFVEEFLKKQRVFDKALIIHTTPDDAPALIYLAPYCGMAIAEYFREKGKKVLIVFDDLTTHAKVYREISLLSKRNPGRDIYPGDIFFIHASLLERAGYLKDGSSITALPLAETLGGDLSGYIQTNLMGMTDGHIFFDLVEFRKGNRPAINAFLSVTRVGNQTRTKIEKSLASWIRKKMLDYQRLSEFIKFGAELSVENQKLLELGRKIEILFHQTGEITIERVTQIILIGLLIFGFWDEKSEKRMREEVEKIKELSAKKLLPSLGERIERIKDITHLQFLMKQIAPKIEKLIKF